MSALTLIEWTNRSWNPTRGCSRVSEGCRNCYAETFAARNLAGMRSPTTGLSFAVQTPDGARWRKDAAGAPVVELIPDALDEPLHWRKPQRVFVDSMSDLFHESLPDHVIDRVFAVMAWVRRHTYQVLTKRAERMLAYSMALAALDPEQRARRMVASMYKGHPAERLVTGAHETAGSGFPWPLPNVWLGVSVEDQATADERIPLLLQTPAAVRFVSYEPALAAVDLDGDAYSWRGWLRGWHCEPTHASGCDGSCSSGRCPEPTQVQNEKLDWLIVGGESGPGARPFNVEWARSIVRQCKAAGVPAFVKQLGANPIDKRWTENNSSFTEGPRLSDRKGGDPSEWPADLRVREFPA